MANDNWSVQIKGRPCSESWEISVVHKTNRHGKESWGWFNEKKYLISHNGGPCRWPICQFVWDRQIQTANDLCSILNSECSPPNATNHRAADKETK